MLFADQAGLRRGLVRRLVPERLATIGADIEARQPARQAYGPESEIAEREDAIPAAFDLAHREQDEPEHRLRRLMLRKNEFDRFADERETGRELVVALRLVEGMGEMERGRGQFSIRENLQVLLSMSARRHCLGPTAIGRGGRVRRTKQG